MVSQPQPAPTFWKLFGWLLLISAILYARPPNTSFIFDEQEALLGNPYLQGSDSALDAFRVDFWGRPPSQSIGSYRPLPSLLWWLASRAFGGTTPFALQLLNIVAHAWVAALVGRVTGRWLDGQPGTHWAAWLSSSFAVVCAASSEAPATVVGLADILAAGFALLAVLALRLALGQAALLIGCSLLAALLCKETALASLLAVPVAGLLAPRSGGGRWGKLKLVAAATAGSLGALLSWTVIRRAFLREALTEAGGATSGFASQWLASLLGWLGMFEPPISVVNNPLLGQPFGDRLPALSRLFVENVVQLAAPLHSSADYSVPRQPVAVSWLWFGAALALLAAALVPLARLAFASSRSQAGKLMGLGLCWMLLHYLPISNLMVLLPTIRAERLLYPLGLGLAWLFGGWLCRGAVVSSGAWPSDLTKRVALFGLLFHALQTRSHAMHYVDDVAFWRAARLGAPASAKSHLNYGIMMGARGALDLRVRETATAVKLAPAWPLVHYYLGDALCRRGDFEQALAAYRVGLRLDDKKRSLAALMLQCLWQSGRFEQLEPQLKEIAEQHPDTWFSFLLSRTSEEQGGVPLRYRPRGYNEPARTMSQLANE